MQTNEDIELQVWEYIDGTCSLQNQERIALLIAHNEEWKSTYHSLMLLQEGINTNLELAEPSVRFSKNVMESISILQPLQPAKTYINKSVIRGIAAVFILTIATTLIYAVAAINWSTPANIVELPVLKFNMGSVQDLMNPLLLNLLIGGTVILGLVFLDSALRARRVQQLH